MANYEPSSSFRVKTTTLSDWTLGLLFGPWVFSVILLLIFYLLSYCTKKSGQNTESWRNWSEWRNDIALVLSASQLQEVKEFNLAQQTNDNLPNEEKSCKVHNRVIKATTKGIFYDTYLISFPLQVVTISVLILQKMFTEQYTVESCESFITIFNNTNQKPYYDCSHEATTYTSDKVESHCSGNMSVKDFTETNIYCTQYYFETSNLIEAVVIGYSAHLLLSKILVYLIHFLHFLVRRSAPITNDGIQSCSSRYVFIPLVLLISILTIPCIISACLVIMFVLRFSGNTIRNTLDEISHGNQLWDLLTYGGLILFPSFFLFCLMILLRFNYIEKEYRACLTLVSCVPPNDQPIGRTSYFFLE
jgi:hypothetical protein